MHRQNPLQQGFVGYTGSGARALVEEISDNPMMQEMKGSFLGGENREKIESPQNYGFTSVVKKATKGKDGKIDECAEAYLMFLGGNRSFPVAAVMDDRRYRLKELKEGDVAFYDYQQQQFHMNEKGTFLTGLEDKKIRFALHKVEDEQGGGGGSGGGGGAAARAETGGGGGDTGQSGGGQKKKGQKQRYEKAEQESKRFWDLNKDKFEVKHDGNIEAKAEKTLKLEGQAIARKATAHYFKGDVHITGKLFISEEGYKPSNGDWLPGTAQPPPEDSDDVAEYVRRPPAQLTPEQQAFIDRKRMLADKIKITDEGIFIDGDLAVTGNLTVTGIVRAKDFVKVA